MSNEGRVKGIGEVHSVIRRADGSIKESSVEVGPVTYRLDANGQPYDVQREA